MSNIKNRDALLEDLSNQLLTEEARCIRRKARLDVACLQVTMYTPDGSSFEFSLAHGLNILAHDLYFDERGDWSDAATLSLETI